MLLCLALLYTGVVCRSICNFAFKKWSLSNLFLRALICFIALNRLTNDAATNYLILLHFIYFCALLFKDVLCGQIEWLEIGQSRHGQEGWAIVCVCFVLFCVLVCLQICASDSDYMKDWSVLRHLLLIYTLCILWVMRMCLLINNNRVLYCWLSKYICFTTSGIVLRLATTSVWISIFNSFRPEVGGAPFRYWLPYARLRAVGVSHPE